MVSKLQSFSTNKASLIFFVLFTIALYMLFSLITKIAPLTISHAIYYCQKALSNILFTLPHFALPLVILLLISIILVGLSLLAIHVSKTRLYIKRTLKDKAVTPEKVTNIAKQLGIVTRIDVVKNKSLLSFCYGFIKPRICFSLKLVQVLSEEELKAVLIHESYHLKNRDPLKILVSQIAISMFFFVPILKDFHNYFTLSKEVAADGLAIRAEGIKDLRSALTKVLLNPSPALTGVASFGSDNLEQRINILTNTQKTSIKISAGNFVASLLVFIFALAVLNMPVYAIETGDKHTFFVCPYGGECMLSCAKQDITEETPFSSEPKFTPANYTPNN